MAMKNKIHNFLLILMFTFKIVPASMNDGKLEMKRKMDVLNLTKKGECTRNDKDELFKKTQQERMEHLLLTGKKSDVQFMVINKWTGEEKLFKVHTFVLNVGQIISPKLEGQFRTNELTEWPDDKPIPVEDIEPSAFSAMLRYLYLGELNEITNENFAHVLDAAQKYLLPSLVDECVHMLLADDSMLDIYNVLDIWTVAKLYNEEALIDHCLRFIDTNIADLIKTDEFLLELNRDEIYEIFSRETLLCDNELALFQSMDRWAHQQCVNNKIDNPTGEEKRAAIGKALEAIRFPVISLSNFVEKILPTGILDAHWQKILLHNFNESNAKAHFSVPFSSQKRYKIPKNKWNEADSGSLTISKEVLTSQHQNTENCVRAVDPIPQFNFDAKQPQIATYFEAKILSIQSFNRIWIGFCDKQLPLKGKAVANIKNTIGLGWKNGITIDTRFHKFENAKGTFEVGDVIGIGLVHVPATEAAEHPLMECFATCNGELLGKVILPAKFVKLELYPMVSLCCGNSIHTNFGSEKWEYNPREVNRIK